MALSRWVRPLTRRVIRPLIRASLDTHVVIGNPCRVSIGERVALANAILDVTSGSVSISSRTIFSYGVMVLTGRHTFREGQRVSTLPGLDDGSWGGGPAEVPESGFDITIGRGVWVGAGAIILGGANIGDNSIVASGAVVRESFPPHSFLGGVPARRLGDTRTRID